MLIIEKTRGVGIGIWELSVFSAHFSVYLKLLSKKKNEVDSLKKKKRKEKESFRV